MACVICDVTAGPGAPQGGFVVGVCGGDEAAGGRRVVGLRGRGGVPEGGALLLVLLFPEGCAQVAQGSAAQGAADTVARVPLESWRRLLDSYSVLDREEFTAFKCPAKILCFHNLTQHPKLNKVMDPDVISFAW